MESDHDKVLRQIFDKFDTDKSGKIDHKELQTISVELGKPLEDSQIQKIIKQIDTNKDGKISFDEFKLWWSAGSSLGTDGLENLVYLQLKALKLLGKFHSNVGHIGTPLESKFEGVSQSLVSFAFGDPENHKTKFGINVTYDQQHEQFKLATDGLNHTNEDFSVVLTFKSTNPNALSAKLEEFWNTVSVMIGEMNPKAEQLLPLIKVSFHPIGDYVKVHALLDKKLLGVFVQGAQAAQERFINSKLNFDVGFSLKNDFSSLTKEGGANPLDFFNDGFLLELNATSLASYLNSAQDAVKNLDKIKNSIPNKKLRKILPYITLLKSFKIAFQFSNQETTSVVSQALQGQPIPNSLELFSQGQAIIESQGLKEMATQFPFVEELVAAFNEFGVFDFSLNLIVLKGLVGFTAKTSGIKQIYNKIWNGQ